MEEGGRKKEAEEYQTHLEEELAESQVLSMIVVHLGRSTCHAISERGISQLVRRSCHRPTSPANCKLYARHVV